MPKANKIKVYTDGSCLGNPGPGGWAYVVVDGDTISQMSGGAAETTNNRMELMAVINALTSLKKASVVTLYSDSQYVIKAFKEGWLEKWKANGWKNSTGDVKNKDLWKLLLIVSMKHELTWEWVKGHAGDQYNEICDSLAVSAAKHYQKNGDTPLHIPEPGDEGEAAEARSETSSAGSAADESNGKTSDHVDLSLENMADPEQESLIDTGDELTSDGDMEGGIAYVDRDMDEWLFLQAVPEQASVEQIEMDGRSILRGLESFIRMYNKETTGIEFPCGNFDWCEHCQNQSQDKVKCNCAEAYMKYVQTTKGNDEEESYGES